jgi:hypothetical protein
MKIECYLLDQEAYGAIISFLRDVLEPWAKIEGSETGESQQKLIEAMGYEDEINLGLMLLLDQSIRSMVSSDWFKEMLSEEEHPYDYYTQGIAEARRRFPMALHKAISRAKQFGGKYGGHEAEAWILAYKPIHVDCPRDTDGDGNCGQPMCPICGFALAQAKGQ